LPSFIKVRTAIEWNCKRNRPKIVGNYRTRVNAAPRKVETTS